MQIGEKIKNYRKTAGLTQEQVADYLDVSTPAVNKWEKGNTYPDISLLPAIARLLKIDMNELFSFREELTEKEIGQFVNELSEVSLDSFIKAFEMGKNKIKEYPHCDSLIYSIATVLNTALTLSDVDDEKKLECNNVIVEWLERTAESPNEKVRISSLFMLAAKYIQMEKYKEANIFLDKIPDTVIDATIMKTNVLAHQEGTDIAAFFLEGKLMQTVTNIQNYLYKLTYALIIGVVREQAQGLDVPETDQQFIAHFYKYAFVGLILDWIKEDMRGDPALLVERLGVIVHGNIRAALERIAKQKN